MRQRSLHKKDYFLKRLQTFLCDSFRLFKLSAPPESGVEQLAGVDVHLRSDGEDCQAADAWFFPCRIAQPCAELARDLKALLQKSVVGIGQGQSCQAKIPRGNRQFQSHRMLIHMRMLRESVNGILPETGSFLVTAKCTQHAAKPALHHANPNGRALVAQTSNLVVTRRCHRRVDRERCAEQAFGVASSILQQVNPGKVFTGGRL